MRGNLYWYIKIFAPGEFGKVTEVASSNRF